MSKTRRHEYEMWLPEPKKKRKSRAEVAQELWDREHEEEMKRPKYETEF